MRFSIFNIEIFSTRAKEWPKVRKNHLKKYPVCAACGGSRKLQVHHIKPVHEYPELELEENNLITLCAKPCHIVFGHLKNWKSWNTEVIDDCAKYLTKVKGRP